MTTPLPQQPIPPGIVVAVVGPTAVGKSDLAIALAEAIDGEVVNTDAMQVYRGMDIGTAKVPPAQRRVPHHLLDVLDVTEAGSVAEFQATARVVISDLTNRAKSAVLVGGSGLYTDAVTDALDFPGTDPAVRDRWEQRLADLGPVVLHAELARVDPVAAAAINDGNGRRIVRALEVIELTGRPFRATLPPPAERTLLAHHRIGLSADRDVIESRIAARVQRMWADGLVEEVRALAAAGLNNGRTARTALGYAQVLQFLSGEIDEQAAQSETTQATIRFARRQMAWFRRDPRVHWLPHDDADLLQRALAGLTGPAAEPPQPVATRSIGT